MLQITLDYNNKTTEELIKILGVKGKFIDSKEDIINSKDLVGTLTQKSKKIKNNEGE